MTTYKLTPVGVTYKGNVINKTTCNLLLLLKGNVQNKSTWNL